MKFSGKVCSSSRIFGFALLTTGSVLAIAGCGSSAAPQDGGPLHGDGAMDMVQGDAAPGGGGSTASDAGLSSSGGGGVDGPAATGGLGGATGTAGAAGAPVAMSGGSSGNAGVSGTAGNHSGGAPGTGGATAGAGGAVVATGGRAAITGGASGTGGRVGTGGSVGTGGAATTGGAPGTGGVMGTGGMGTGGIVSTGGASVTTGSLYVVAHPDDELLFMNPDLEADIQSGRPVLTVYVTSGDGGNPNSEWRLREMSGMAAHAAMAGVANSWTCAPATYAGKPTTRCVLATRPGLSMVMLRVGDGMVPNAFTTAAVATIDNSTTYTRAELTATLAAIQTQLAPARVGTMDGTFAHGSDHIDHVATAVMMFDVARADGMARQVSMYRGYSMFEPAFATPPIPTTEPVNLTDAQYQEKLRIIKVYQAPPLDDPFDQWCRRMYPIRMVTGGSAPLRNSAGQCLQANGSADGSAVTVATCNGSAAQNWTVGGNSRVVGPSGRCLGLGAGGVAAALRTCNTASADQRWTLLADGQLRGTSVNCLTFTGNSVAAAQCGVDMSQARYAPPASQRWGL